MMGFSSQAALVRRRALVGTAAAAVLSAACVHFVDPKFAANTDIGLQVWATVTPTTFHISDTTSKIRIRISAKNPGTDTLHIDNGGACDIQPDPAAGDGLEHSMRIADNAHPLDAGPGNDLCGVLFLTFPPKRTRNWDFYVDMNLWKASPRPPVAQEYRARSFFAGYEGYSALFKLVP